VVKEFARTGEESKNECGRMMKGCSRTCVWWKEERYVEYFAE
jgi:hypothetical protein